MLLLVAGPAVGVAAVLLAGALPRRGAVAFVVAVALIGYAIVVSSVGVAGLLLGTLSPVVLSLLALAALLASAVVALGSPRARAAWVARVRRNWHPALDSLRDVSVALALLLVGISVAWRIVLALRLPLVDYDGWSYHLVFTDVWLQHDAITLVPQRPWTQGYPAVVEIVMTWLGAFSHGDAFRGLASVAAIPFAVAAVTGVARAVGAAAGPALLAGLLFGMTPALVALAGTSYIDGTSTAFVVSTWWLGVRIVRRERDAASALLFGLAAGLALGTKGTNLLLITPVVGITGLVLLADAVGAARVRIRSASFGAAVRRLILVAVPLLVFGASWYMKDLLVYGNPFYPFAAGPFPGLYPLDALSWSPPQLESKGFVDQVVSSWLADWHLTRYVYNVRPGGFGRAWLAIAALGLGGLALALRRRAFAPIVLAVIPAALTFVTAPNAWYARYTLFLVGVAAALAALVLTSTRQPLRSVAGLVLVGLAAVSLVFTNIHPNIELRPAVARPPARVTAGQYLRYVFRTSDARRADVGLWHACSGFEVVPPGSVVVPAGFNLLHGVVGLNLDRILGDPVAGVADGPSLAGAVRAEGASWFVTSSGSDNDAIAAASPDLFVPVGDVCQGARLWRLASTS